MVLISAILIGKDLNITVVGATGVQQTPYSLDHGGNLFDLLSVVRIFVYKFYQRSF